MNKIIILSSFLVVGLLSCGTSEKDVDKIEIARKYYAALDSSNAKEISALLTDTLFTKEIGYDYEQSFSLREYVEWLAWDSVFDPTYKILEIEQQGDNVMAKISKIDKRISFLHEEPIVTNERIRFNRNKIKSIERANELFDDSVFVKNRDEFLNWIDQNHPELNGFIHDQTKDGGIKYLKAIELYNSRKSVIISPKG